MEIPMSFQLPVNPLAYAGNSLASKGNLPQNGNLPTEAKRIPGIG